MGDAAFLNQRAGEPAAVPAPRNRRYGLDFSLIGVVAALLLFGLLMVYSSSPLAAARMDQPPDYFLKRQIIWLVVGVFVAGFLTVFNYRYFRKLAIPMLAVTLLLLIMVPIIGQDSLNAVRSLVGNSIRPSELSKIVVLIYLSVWLDSKRYVLNSISFGLIPLVSILGINAALILLQPDLSAAMTVVVIGMVLFFMAGADWRQLMLILVGTFLVGWLTATVMTTGQHRLSQFIAGLQDPTKASSHIVYSFQAIISGGLFGVGIGRSSLKFIGLPVAHTDSIFAVLAEETGLLGMGLLIFAYLMLLWRGLTIARNAPDRLGRLLASGITVWIIAEAILNIGVMVNLFPNAGNALPFISYGGSSLVTTLAGIGILLSISRMPPPSRRKGDLASAPIIDLRWRDGRRGVSRPVSSPEDEG